MNNIKIRVAMTRHNVKQWQLAEKLGISEASLSRLLRHELPEAEQDRIVGLIEAGVNEK